MTKTLSSLRAGIIRVEEAPEFAARPDYAKPRHFNGFLCHIALKSERMGKGGKGLLFPPSPYLLPPPSHIKFTHPPTKGLDFHLTFSINDIFSNAFKTDW